jgi:rare lipoprotein A (peptidoglycan hydrolase)
MLAVVALLAAAVSLAVTSSTREPASTLPEPVGSYTALAGTSPKANGRRTACPGVVIGARTEGVAHPVLPCGVRVYITYGGKTVLTQVIDRGPYVPGRQFDLTARLALRLGLTGVQKIQWSYARTK